MFEAFKGDDILGLLDSNNHLNPYVVVGNSHSVEFLDIMEREYEKKRLQQIEALKLAIDDGKLNIRTGILYENLIKRLESIDFGRKGERSVDSQLHNNGEWFVKLLTSVRDKDVGLVFLSDARRPNDDMMELFNICDASARAGARNINIYMPFIPGQREDKKDEGRTPISARLVFKLMEDSCGGKLARIITSDLHAGQEQGFTDRPVDNLYGSILFTEYLKSEQFVKKYGDLDKNNVIAVAPDVGRVKAVKSLADILDIDYLVVQKKRITHGEAELDKKGRGDIKEKVCGKTVFLIEDMVDTGGTLKENGNMLMGLGAKKIMCGFTHLIGSPKYDKSKRKWYNLWEDNIISYAEDNLREGRITAITTDSIPTINGVPKTKEYYEENRDWMGCVISLAPTYAEIMLANRVPGGSVSYLINKRVKEVKNSEFGSLDMSDEIIFE